MLTIRVAVFELLFLIENAFLICTDKPVELHKVKAAGAGCAALLRWNDVH